MSRPPLWMRLRFQNQERDFRLWLPLFLLLPLALVVLIILSPLILIALLVLWPTGWAEWAVRVLWPSFGIFHAMRGLEVDIQNREQNVYISVI